MKGDMDNLAVQVKEMDKLIQKMRKLVDGLYDKAEGIQAVERTLDRISANLKMLEINISDVRDLL
jgi:predicted component of type VI protein secretion system